MQWIQFQTANSNLEAVKLKQTTQTGIMNRVREIMNTPAFREVEKGINDAAEQAEKFGRALQALGTKGVYGYIEEMSRDEQAELDRQIQQLSELQQKSRDLEAELKKAIAALEKHKGRITDGMKETQSHIYKLEEEIKLKPFDDAYRNKKNDHDRVVAQVQVIQMALNEIKKGVDASTKAAKQTVDKLKTATPQITLIVVKASTKVFNNNEPLLFLVDVTWSGDTTQYELSWTPGSQPSDLYKSIADKVVGFC